MKTEFKATGLVWGRNWGFTYNGYASRTIFATSKEELLGIANAMLKDGSLDAGMGYESLTGAALKIVKSSTIMHEGRPYTNEETEIVFIGNLDDKTKRLLKKTLND